MQIVDRLDFVFIIVHSILILGGGALVSIISKHWLPLPITSLAWFFYLAGTVKKPLGRIRALKQKFPDEWRPLLLNLSPFYCHLHAAGRRIFERDIILFLHGYSVTGIRNLPASQSIRLAVAAGVASMLHGQPAWDPPIRDGVVIYPGQQFNRDYRIGKGNYTGQASLRGPMILSEGGIEESLLQPGDGYNTVIHELAHYFDLEDGSAEGIPQHRLPAAKLDRWQSIIRDEWQRVRRGDSMFRDYAGSNEAELFAVACESFFENPRPLRSGHPELYGLLRDFFNLDPAEMIP